MGWSKDTGEVKWVEGVGFVRKEEFCVSPEYFRNLAHVMPHLLPDIEGRHTFVKA